MYTRAKETYQWWVLSSNMTSLIHLFKKLLGLQKECNSTRIWFSNPQPYRMRMHTPFFTHLCASFKKMVGSFPFLNAVGSSSWKKLTFESSLLREQTYWQQSLSVLLWQVLSQPSSATGKSISVLLPQSSQLHKSPSPWPDGYYNLGALMGTPPFCQSWQA